jgi:BirA family biotin operon repressor/biotin-[acetyl-CoA-carboxylase] ligase
MKILSCDQIPSTNAYALRLAEQGAPQETVIWARTQTAGRGQYNRQFACPPGGLYFSLIIQPDLPISRLSLVTLAAGVGCCCSLEQICSVVPLLKWPNDLYIHGSKLGGILTETLPFKKKQKATVIIGVGLNINSRSEDFSEELCSTVTSITDCTRQSFDLRMMLESIVLEILRKIHLLKRNQDKLLAQWHQRDYLRNQFLEWDNGQRVISGIGQGILDNGQYSLLDDTGTLHKIIAGTLKRC